jgi:hypothetical protein
MALGMFLRKYTISASGAQLLMKSLLHDDVSAASIFPGYGGVVEAMREKVWVKTGVYDCPECGAHLSPKPPPAT